MPASRESHGGRRGHRRDARRRRADCRDAPCVSAVDPAADVLVARRAGSICRRRSCSAMRHYPRPRGHRQRSTCALDGLPDMPALAVIRRPLARPPVDCAGPRLSRTRFRRREIRRRLTGALAGAVIPSALDRRWRPKGAHVMSIYVQRRHATFAKAPGRSRAKPAVPDDRMAVMAPYHPGWSQLDRRPRKSSRPRIWSSEWGRRAGMSSMAS